MKIIGLSEPLSGGYTNIDSLPTAFYHQAGTFQWVYLQPQLGHLLRGSTLVS